ncbi:hypothetical protein P9112_004686 [Eukaryota sp. TZLM1-RC]
MSQRRDIIDLHRFINKDIHITLAGGRQFTGTLKGYDSLLNCVLADMSELLRDPSDLSVVTDKKRSLGMGVIKGAGIAAVYPL